MSRPASLPAPDQVVALRSKGQKGWHRLRTKRVVAVAAMAGLYFAALLVATRLGWYPTGLQGYLAVGVLCILALCAGTRLPISTLVIVGGYLLAVQLGLTPSELVVPVEVLIVPLLIAGFLAASSKARLDTVLPVYAASAVLIVIPWSEYLAYLLAGRPLAEMVSGLQAYDRSEQVLLLVLAAITPVLAIILRRQRLTSEKLRQRNIELEQMRKGEFARIAAAERTAIAREIHDVVAHHVAALVIRAQAAVRVADTQPGELKSAVEGLARSGQEALSELRQVVRVLRTPASSIDPAGLESLHVILEAIVKRVQEAGLTVSLDLVDTTSLSHRARAAVVRIVQESLTNVMLHSASDRAQVEVIVRLQVVTVTVCDAGPSRESLPDAVGGGSGIAAMAERARAFDGSLTAGPDASGTGWVVAATFADSGILKPSENE